MDAPNQIRVNVDGYGRQPQAPRQTPRQAPKRKKPKSKAFKALLITFCVLVAALLTTVIVVYANVSKIWGDLGFDENAIILDEEPTDDVAGLSEVTFSQGDVVDIVKSGSQTDILLVGVDNRDTSKFTGRSDVLMYLRVDPDNNSIKLVSLMRDTLVAIDKHDKNKLNTAYHFGSIPLLQQTLKSSFGLSPDYYMVVNFFGMEDILDALGGVDIDLAGEELQSLNSSVKEANAIDGKNISGIKNDGVQHLNGRQAVAYMRIRHPGGDAGRIERQQKVLNELFKGLSDISGSEMTALIPVLIEYVRTDMPIGTMMDMATAVKGMDSSNLQKFRYPEDYKNGSYEGMSVVQPTDFNTEYGKLYAFLEN